MDSEHKGASQEAQAAAQRGGESMQAGPVYMVHQAPAGITTRSGLVLGGPRGDDGHAYEGEGGEQQYWLGGGNRQASRSYSAGAPAHSHVAYSNEAFNEQLEKMHNSLQSSGGEEARHAHYRAECEDVPSSQQQREDQMDLVSSVGSDMGLLGGTPEMNRHEDASRHHQASGWPGGGGGKDRIPLSDQTAPGGTFRLAGLASALPEAPPPGVTLTPRSYQRHRASRVQELKEADEVKGGMEEWVMVRNPAHASQSPSGGPFFRTPQSPQGTYQPAGGNPESITGI